MKTEITHLQKGQKFTYDGKEWIITDDSYPFPEAKCLTEKHEYDTVFTKPVSVEVDNNAKLYTYSFEEIKKDYYIIKREKYEL